VLGEITIDGSLQVGDRAEDAAADALSRHLLVPRGTQARSRALERGGFDADLLRVGIGVVGPGPERDQRAIARGGTGQGGIPCGSTRQFMTAGTRCTRTAWNRPWWRRSDADAASTTLQGQL
jgi:hypothetical protein